MITDELWRLRLTLLAKREMVAPPACPAPPDTAWLQRNIDRVLDERRVKKEQLDRYR
jgi:hypothetical protein